MIETRNDPRTVPLTDAQLDSLELAARASFGEDERSQAMINGVLSLIIEVRKLRQSFDGDAQAADLSAIEARLAASTPGPWKVDGQPGYAAPVVTSSLGIKRPIAKVLYYGGSEDREVDYNAKLIAAAPADLRALVAEVRRLRHDDAIWDKYSLVQIVKARDELREEGKRLRLALETEQRAKWAAEQDKQHWQEEAERLRQELDVTDMLLDTTNQVLDAIPECPDHGSRCVPHALEWIEEQVAQRAGPLEVATE